MRAGADVISQAALVVPPWLGYADFLERIEEASSLGPWSFEAVDTKLPRRPKPGHVIQLATYSRLMGNEQGRMPFSDILRRQISSCSRQSSGLYRP